MLIINLVLILINRSEHLVIKSAVSTIIDHEYVAAVDTEDKV